MRIVVTGREGQVARSLAERGVAAGHDIVAAGRPHLDLAGPPAAIIATLESLKPDAIVSAAAYTSVDEAERNETLAQLVNSQGPAAVAAAAKMIGIPLIHLSTDYVFAGDSSFPHREDDATGPTGVYGRSKLAGEFSVLNGHDNAAVLRVAWIYSPYGSNFVKTMLRLAADQREVRVVADQFGNPTSALDIADGILGVLANLWNDEDPSLRGLFHMPGSGEASWADLAEEIFAASIRVGGPSARVVRIGTDEYPTIAARPKNSRLDGRKLARVHAVSLPNWRCSTQYVVDRLVNNRKPEKAIG